MLIADLARQYRRTTSSSESLSGTRGVEKLVSSIRDLTAGNVFEGTVNSVKNGQVVLGLSNGTELKARLDAGMQLVQGQSMFFQVKSNTGDMIAIRPYTVDGSGVNLTLLNALKAAGLPVSEKFLNMANAMMQEQMPIDKNSMTQMARILMANPDMNVNTLVQMKKLDIPITAEMVAQFENYMDDSSAVHKALDSFISELPTVMAGKDLPPEQLEAFDSRLLSILAEGMEEGVQQVNSLPMEKIIHLLNSLFGDVGITKNDSPANLLHKLSQLILNGEISKDALGKLFSSSDMQQFLRNVMEEQMYLTPEDAADGDKVKTLYKRLESKTQNLSNLLNSAGLNETPLAQTIADIHSNVDFMNQLNQNFTYVQIPLKMSEQNASGQLYVYTNKKDLNDPDRDLTAFLHLDLDHLGSTDVSVRLHRKEVDTKFYMDNDEAYALLKRHMPELEERLRLKGFNCRLYVENEGKKVNFVEDFLKKDIPAAAQLHRYSFDVRA